MTKEELLDNITRYIDMLLDLEEPRDEDVDYFANAIMHFADEYYRDQAEEAEFEEVYSD